MKKFISAFIAVVMTLGVISGSFNEIVEAADKYITVNVNGKVQNYEKVKVEVDGKNLEGDMPAILYEEFTMVPIRFVADAIGAETTWDNDLREATVKKSGTTIKVKIGEAKATVNGVETPIARGATSIIGNDRTLLPIRFIAETLNFKVDWNNETRSAILTSKTEAKGDYKVYQNENLINTFDNKEEAIVYAKLYTDTTIHYQGDIIWNFYLYGYSYHVYRGKTLFNSHDKLEGAIEEAMKWEDSIIQYEDDILWRYKHDIKTYNVYDKVNEYEDKVIRKIKSFENFSDAIIEAKKWPSSVVYYQNRDVWDNYRYETYYALYRGTELLEEYVHFKDAIEEGVKWEDSIIKQKDNVLWSCKDNAKTYNVYQSDGSVYGKYEIRLGSFSNFEDAVVEAKKHKNVIIEYQGKEVWSYDTNESDYYVYQGETVIYKHNRLENAIKEAMKWGDSTVERKDNVLWSYKENSKTYNIYQWTSEKIIRLGSFSNFEDAVVEAKKWPNSAINYQGSNEWGISTYDDRYNVYQGETLLNGFYHIRDAIIEAMKWEGSTIEQEDEVLWSYKEDAKVYNVYSGNTKKGSFSNLDDAIVGAQKWRSTVVNYQGNILWENPQKDIYF